MNSVEVVKNVCKDRKLAIAKLERDLGFSNGYIGQLRKGVFPTDRLVLIADYLGVSVEYLLNGDNTDNHEEHNNGWIDGLSDFEKTVLEMMRSNSEFKAQVDLAVELAKRKAAQKDG